VLQALRRLAAVTAPDPVQAGAFATEFSSA
jgi:hypothetical protein